MSKFILIQTETITNSYTDHVLFTVEAASEAEALVLHKAGKSQESVRKTVVVHADARFVGDVHVQREQ
jgi:hypothetical protein